MSNLRFVLITIVQTLLRVLPFPRKTGLIKIGNPGRNAPVLLTGNFQLTVERVRRALRGIDAYLLVANSRGLNVWCAATGGHLTNHDVVSVVKTSGIDALVDHREVILPQLAATGIEGRMIHRRTGWRVIWGPVYASAIPQFLAAGLTKTPEMRTVRFAWPQRIEMAVAWAFPLSLLAVLALPFWASGTLPLVAFVWCAAVLVFVGFPLYQTRLRTKKAGVGCIFFNFGTRGVLLLFWAFFICGVLAYSVWDVELSWRRLLQWGFGSLIVLLILGLDLTGSTPVYKSGLHEDRRLDIEIDPEQCKGIGFCEQVCPTNVFTVDPDRRLASLPRAAQCVQCGACIVQCPFDALHFRSPTGDVVAPEIIRRFKLNLLGGRTVVVRSGQPEK